MATPSRHLSVWIDRPPAEVAAFVARPVNLARWAAGLGSAPVEEDGAWWVQVPGGRARITFAPPNPFGVLDHDVLTPAGETVHVPMRVLPDGDGSEVVFTVRPAPGTGEDEFARDVAAVRADLATLKAVLESTTAP